MTQLTFDEWACRNTQAKLDSYIDNELLVETNLEMAQHFQRCPSCTREAAARRELRARLKAAARLVPLPPGLDARVRQTLRESGRSRAPWSIMAIAAMIVVSFASWLGYERSLLRIGVGNHLHCAVIRQQITKPVGQDKLSAKWKPVLAIAREHAPAGMSLAVAHECTFKGRSFAHITFRDGRHLVSIAVTRKGDWQRLPGELHADRFDGYQSAAFETGGFLVYAVSDLSKQENLRLLAAMAPAIRKALDKGEKS